MQQVVYARHEHGGHRVVRDTQGGGITVHWPHGPTTYPSVRQTLAALVSGSPTPTKGVRVPHRTFDTYFRLRPTVPILDVFALFAPLPEVPLTAHPVPNFLTEPGAALDENLLSVHVPSARKPRTARAPRVAPAPREVWDGNGIDLVNRGHEVRKLFYAGFFGRVARYGYDPEEVLQEVYAGLLVRNRGKCPFDPKKSSFGHYVHMVCECIISNYHRKHNRHAQAEQFGYTDLDGNEVDVAGTDLASVEADQEEALGYERALASLGERLHEAACSVETSADMALVGRCLPLLSEGMTRLEVANHLVKHDGLHRARVLQAVDFIRSVAGEWGASLRGNRP
jgi:hypothetical protein